MTLAGASIVMLERSINGRIRGDKKKQGNTNCHHSKEADPWFSSLSSYQQNGIDLGVLGVFAANLAISLA